MYDEDEPEIPIIRQLERDDILKRYADGERNFSYCVSLSKDFSGVNFSGANFKHAKLIGSSFINANLTDVNFSGAELSSACFRGANIKGANFSFATITGADFSETDTTSANFTGAVRGQVRESKDKQRTTVVNVLGEYSRGRRDFSSVTIPNADFNGKKLPGIIFRNAVLQNSNFNWCDLTDADFSGADLMNAWLVGATLRRTKFVKAYMYFATVRNAIVEDTNFENADLSWNDLAGVNLASANITGALLSWCIIDGSKMNEDQFFRLSPEVARTIKFVSAESSEKPKTEGAKPDVSGSYMLPGSGAAYGAKDEHAGGYAPARAPGGAYVGRGESGNMYVPKEHETYTKKDKKFGDYGLG